jgi:hypothetical protein
MTFYLYRMNGKVKEYFIAKTLCQTHYTNDRSKAHGFNYRFDAEQKAKDYGGHLFIEEAN